MDDEYAWLDEKTEISMGVLDWLVGMARADERHRCRRRWWHLWVRRYYPCGDPKWREPLCAQCEMWTEAEQALKGHWEEDA